MKKVEWIVKTRNPKVRDRWSSQHRKVGGGGEWTEGEGAGAKSTGGACPAGPPLHLTHLHKSLSPRCQSTWCTWPTWPLRREKRTRIGRMSGGREKSDQRSPASSIFQYLGLCSGPCTRSWGGSWTRGPSLLSRGVHKKSIMRLKDHFVTLIFLLRRQIFYSTFFLFFFFFCKNGIHEPIQNADGNMWIWSFLHRNIVHVHLKNRTGLKGKIRRRCD